MDVSVPEDRVRTVLLGWNTGGSVSREGRDTHIWVYPNGSLIHLQGNLSRVS